MKERRKKGKKRKRQKQQQTTMNSALKIGETASSFFLLNGLCPPCLNDKI